MAADCVMVMSIAAVCSGVGVGWAARQPISILRGSIVCCSVHMLVIHDSVSCNYNDKYACIHSVVAT